MSGRKGMVHYALDVKREAVRLVEEEYLSYEEVVRRLAIRRVERIERWVGMYRKEGEISFHKPKGRPRKVENEQSELKRLRMENALLKRSHSELRKLPPAQRKIGRSSTAKKTSQ